ncbi:FAD-binding oxidoreductase [Albimonas sp. CAU 1670]|uniref:FAD-binding oxidoreductase n=1 Tax=Albimonas sp. CAU 1670 TaxID=3032599 RepID=UPI0023DB7D38|nr:FAD-binding oxidoreductase [Albimonas sp. CAU 1670]MDF2233746.1 FAD-binding oxidoreductase [Albimonas sp. CAU 1670]
MDEMQIETLRAQVRGIVLAAGEPGWELALETLLWNGRKPARRPAAIVRAADVEDVRHAVRYAAANGLTVSPRGAGHNWSGAAQQAGVVIDLAGLDEIRVDAAAMTAEVGPGATNRALVAALEPHGLGFPVGHCGSVPMSGYLLGGGIGWNAGRWGVACMRVESVEVVTADGALLTASAERNADLFWAARGAGPLFFGVVVGYRLRLAPAPRAIRTGVWTWPLEAHEDVAAWMQATMAWAPASVEFTAKFCAAPPPLALVSAKVVMAIATVFEDAAEAGDAILARIGAAAPAGALEAQVGLPTPIPALYDLIDAGFPRGRRMAVDAMWSDAAPSALFGAIARGVARAPDAECFGLGVVRSPLAPVPPAGAAAFSMIGPVFGALYAMWRDPSGDAAGRAWVRGVAREAAPAVKGVYVGEADLAAPGRLAQAWTPEALSRLAALRARHDPRNRFRREFAEPGCEETAAA